MTTMNLHYAKRESRPDARGARSLWLTVCSLVIGLAFSGASASAEVRHAIIDSPTVIQVDVDTDYLPYDICSSDHSDQARQLIADMVIEQINDPADLYVIALPQAPVRFSAPSLDGAIDMNGDRIPGRRVSRTRRNYEDALDEAFADILSRVRAARPGAMLSIEGLRDIRNRNKVRFEASGGGLDFVFFDHDLMRRVPRSRRTADLSRILRSLERWLEQSGMNENHFIVLRAGQEWLAVGVGSDAPIDQLSEEDAEEIASAWIDDDEGEGPEIAVGELPPGENPLQQRAEAPVMPVAPGGAPQQEQMRAAAKDPDLNLDGRVNSEDSALLLGFWGSNHAPADLNNDGKVGSEDLAILIGSFTEMSSPAAVQGDFQPSLNRYVQGSGQTVGFNLTEGGAPGTYVQFQVWSHELSRSEMPFDDRDAPFEYPATLFDLVTPGAAQLQAVVRDPQGQVLSTFVLDLEVVANDEQIAGGDDEPEPNGPGADPRAVITLMDTTTQRMAPQTVHVHATDSNLGDPDYMWQRATIEWDFGDNSGQRQTTTDPRSGRTVDLSTEQVGFNAAYIYRTPGTYTITMRLTNESGRSDVVQKTVTIVPDTRARRYVDGVAGSDSNTGSSPSDAWRTIGHALESLQDNMSLYLRRGQVFGSSTPLEIGHIKNIYVGDFGSGTGNPIIRWQGPAERVTFWSHKSRGENIMLENLVFETIHGINVDGNSVRAVEPNAKLSTLVNCEFRGKNEGDAFSRVISTTSGVTGILVQNCHSSIAGGRAIPFRGSDHCYIGFSIDGGAKLLMRGGFSGMDRLNSSWCSFIKGDFGGGGVRYGTVQWGYLYQSVLHEGVNDIGHDDADTDYIVVDGCVFDDAEGGLGCLVLHHNGQNLMLRNNVFINDEDYRGTIKTKTSSSFSGLHGIENVDILNNTFIVRNRQRHAPILDLVNTDYEITNIRVCNNLFATPDGFNQAFIMLKSYDGLNQSMNNVYPDLGVAHQYFEVSGAEVAWSSWEASPKTANEARESVNQTELQAPQYGPGSSNYPITHSNGRPIPGVVADFHGHLRGNGGRSAQMVGAVSDND